MPHWPVKDALQAAGARFAEVRSIEVAVDFGDPHGEYQAALSGAALYSSPERALIEITGADRIDWLHNLVSNTVKDLQEDQGHYTFALDAKGRILMDFNMLVFSEAIWIDMDRRLVPNGLVHFDRYTFAEKVSVRDRRDDFGRLAILGPAAESVCASLGVPQASAMAALDSTTIMLAGKPARMVRHDFAGVFGVELYVATSDAPAWWEHLMETGQPVGLRPIGRSAVRLLQIEAGIPVYGEDIDEGVVAAETRQTDRAVSFTKGCYLGQEIVGRMHSRGEVARILVGLKLIDPPADLPHHKPLIVEGKVVGRLTSSGYSPAAGSAIALGYLAAVYAIEKQHVQIACDPPVEAEVVPLPFRPINV